MLILQRKEGESIKIGDDIEVRIAEIGSGIVKIAIDAPKSINIFRTELLTAANINKEAVVKSSDFNLLKKFAKNGILLENEK